MPAGKLSAQAGHAYTDSLWSAPTDLANHYRNDGAGGSKVTLQAKNQDQLIRAYREALEAGLPCAIVVDQGHIMPPHFDGSPVITALGIGPVTKAQARHITKRFRCV